VLEDEPLARRMICAALRPKGYEVFEASTLPMAVRVGRQQPRLDLLIADIALPERSGVQAAIELCESFRRLTILFVSGTPFEGWEPRDLLTLQVLPRTSWEFLQKPFRAAKLLVYTRQLLDRAAAPLPLRLEASAAGGSSHPVNQPTMEQLLRLTGSGNDVMTVPNPLEDSGGNDSRAIRRRIPNVVFCREKVSLTEDFLSAIQELTELQTQQTRAVIENDPDFSRFDVLIHLAMERKEQAKYALIRHMEAHHCEEGWSRWH